MLTTVRPIHMPIHMEQASTRQDLLPAEVDFYSAYDWCLDPHLTVREAIDHLRGEIERLKGVPEGWQTSEVATNIFLLSCALLNGVDEYLRGPTLRMPPQLASRLLARGARWTIEKITKNFRWRRCMQVRHWSQGWRAGLDDFLAIFARGAAEPSAFVAAGSRLTELLKSPLPPSLQVERLGVPSAFSRLDLTHFDVLSLGRHFVNSFPDRSQPILLLGLRTAGTYFAALLQALFKAEGYQKVSALTVHPKKGAGSRERKLLKRYADRDYMLLIVDDPPYTGDTIFLAFDIARRGGFDLNRVKAVVPTHPARRKWCKSLPSHLVVSLEPEHWHKRRLLDPRAVERRLAEYFQQRGFTKTLLVDSSRADKLSIRLRGLSRSPRASPLKRIYEVRLQTPRGQTETRYVLAKSVGVGWLGYAAFLAGRRLSDFVPPVLGLRDGILYVEWLPQSSPARSDGPERDSWIETSASYVAARVRSLRLPTNRAPGKAIHERGLRLSAEVLSRAYGRLAIDVLTRPRLQQRLYQQPCPLPTLIDGNMGCSEWIVGRSGLLKTDYEHHGMGKTELNVIDPAYDLAETILHLTLSSEEETRLIRRYVEQSGDAHVGQRLFMNKLLAGLWAMSSAQEHLFGEQQTADKQQEFHQRFMMAWNFLTVHTARFCGSHCQPPQSPCWRSPLVALDIDGVLDRRIFGYPCTTAAGIEALSLLATNGFCVALNTARSVAEVRDYCQAYGLAGGVAEYGSYLWDAVAQLGQVLVSPEAMRQLDELKGALQNLPGIFLDDRHQYSIRVFMYEKPAGLLLRLVKHVRSFSVGDGTPTPLPTLVISHLMTSLRLDRLSFHGTMNDTTIVAKDVNKGAGLVALRDWVLGPAAATIAVGDTEADLPMFGVATHSFAPANIGCARRARLLGCQISRHHYQRGLLDVAQKLVGSDDRQDARQAERTSVGSSHDHLFLELLQAADQTNAESLLGTLFSPTTFKMFVH
jgi:hydroxymethylpyrimidine pyrophosphatase-like HAD family hydrolase